MNGPDNTTVTEADDDNIDFGELINGAKTHVSAKRAENRYKPPKNIDRKNTNMKLNPISPLARKASPMYPKIYGTSLMAKKPRLSVPWNAARRTEQSNNSFALANEE